ncbi:MAG TPA: phosphoenolpyruvate--protein phosphotransferase [Deltaproteobacteria bacterium]|nr:MAG: phosphoenolpyruvate--protein phosphotransferase [Deltaproteobacteria bacterium GWA2_45_12]HBF13932.1 phosphoenolpyruvate--protein phosphotransferase [Deltaproteobacteria bacterium]
MKIRPAIYDFTSTDVMTDILELGHLCHGKEDVKKVLDMLVEKIARIMQVDVCSLYLLDPHNKILELKATKGLNQLAIGVVKMKVGEGLVGKTLEWMKPVSMSTGKRSKQFKYFPETGEEKFSSFLSVPLIYNRQPIGVLVVQNEKKVKFSSQAAHLLMTLAIPAISVVEKAKLLDSFVKISSRLDFQTQGNEELQPKKTEGMVHVGIGAAPGIAIGKIKIVGNHHQDLKPITKEAPIHKDVEKMRVLEAFRWVQEEILDVQKKAEKKFGMEELSIFDAYSMVLESEPFKEEILTEIDKGKSALMAVENVVGRYAEELSHADDEYIRERVFDIHDVGRKIIDRLLYGSEVPRSAFHLTQEAILISDSWSVSDFVELDPEKTKGILSPVGGASSHIAILAESMGIPAVLGLSSFADFIHEDDEVVMDGTSGVVVLNPTNEVREMYRKESTKEAQAQEIYSQYAHKQASPRGGKRIFIGANMGMAANMGNALEQGAEHIGLYRTEMPFLIRRNLPTEEEQFLLYSKVLSTMGGKPVTIRILDIGGDKYVPYLNLPKETNPFLGWRSIRILLEREDLFRIQLRALLRASVKGKLRLLFPMVTSMEEILKVKEILSNIKKELKSKNIAYAPNIPLGIMIEVPSAVEIADRLIREVNFFSIGTNDLVQYTLAVDRNNPKVAFLYSYLHPAVLRMISRTIQVVHKAKKSISVCGEMAGQAEGALLLVGMGIDELSMSTPLIPKMKHLINQVSLPKLKKLVHQVFKADTTAQVEQIMTQFMVEEGLNQFLTTCKVAMTP